MKKASQVVGLALGLALLGPISFLSQSQAQETRVSREGGSWAQEVTGSLAAVKILRVKVDMGSVVVRGGQQQGINYAFHTRYGTSSEQEARRQFDQYKVTAYVKGDTAWIVGDWQGGRHPRHFSGEFSLMVPREMTLVKLETDGGNVDATGLTGRVEAQSGGDSANGAGGFISKVTHQVVMRYRTGITANMQVQFNGRQFQIEAVQNPDERNKMLILQCVEINDSAQQSIG